MRIPLIGPSYTARSVAAAAQRSINLYQETVQVPGEKNKVTLYGAPGLHLFKNLTAIDANLTPVRGIWSGGGRCFVAAGARYCEIDSTGALVGSVRTIADDTYHTPVQFFPNGNQLLIISAGQAYCDNGAGPVACRFQNSGTCTTNGVNVTWVSGDVAAAGWAGRTITINNVNYTVNSVAGTPNWTLTSSAGVQATPVAFNVDGGDLVTATTGAFLDGYGIVQRPDSRQFNISALNNFTVWASLDFDLKSAYPDYLRAIYADHEQLYLMGKETGEVWQNTGNADFPFQRIPGAFAHDGLVATWSPVSLGGSLFYIGGGSRGQAIAYRLDGLTPKRISTHAVEEAWKAYSLGVTSGLYGATLGDPGEGTAYGYQDGGHLFYVINFGSFSGKLSWVYDATEDAWHERASATNDLVTGLPAYSAYAAWFHTFIPEWGNQGTHLVGDYATGKLYQMSTAFTDDDSQLGGVITCQRDMAHIYSEGKRIFHHRVTLEMETGTVASGAAPVATLYSSDDRGHTFGKPDGSGIPTIFRSLSMGTAAQYSTRLYANRMGSSRDRVYRLIIQSKVKVALIDAYVDAEIGTS